MLTELEPDESVRRPFLPWKVNANLMAPKWICVYPCAKQWRGRSDGSDNETKCLTWDAGNWWESNLEVMDAEDVEKWVVWVKPKAFDTQSMVF
nr:hypothetical protein [Tanacetum cinerariifolium]